MPTTQHVAPKMREALEAGDGVSDTAAAEMLESAEEAVLTAWAELGAEITRTHAKAHRLSLYSPRRDTAEAKAEVEELEEAVTLLRRRMYNLIAIASVGQWTAEDVESWIDYVVESGGGTPQFGRQLVGDLLRTRKVPNAGLRAAYLAAKRDGKLEALGGHRSMTARAYEYLVSVEQETGEDLGSSNWLNEYGIIYMRRQLGLIGNPHSKKDKPSFSLFVPYHTGVALSRALLLAPHEFGL